jgi:hypothetical protein
MLEAQLFLGFAVDPLFAKELKKADPQMVKNFINNTAYLKKVSFDEMEYLGKEVGGKTTLESLDLLEKNIISLLKKAVPHFPYGETPLYLIATR